MSQIIHFAGTNIELLPSGLLWISTYRILCASDMHFEKSSFFQRFATFLPPYDTQETLEKLSTAITQFKPEMFISLGDSFHDKYALDRMIPKDRGQLDKLISNVPQWIWIEGNHDANISGLTAGQRKAEYSIGDIVFRHILTPDAHWEISGHYHPKTRISLQGHSITGPCFVRTQNQLVMPAFGSFTGGLDVNSQAFLDVCPTKSRKLYLTHRERIFAI